MCTASGTVLDRNILVDLGHATQKRVRGIRDRMTSNRLVAGPNFRQHKFKLEFRTEGYKTPVLSEKFRHFSK